MPCYCPNCRPWDDRASIHFEASMLRGLEPPESLLPGLAFAVWRLGIVYRFSDLRSVSPAGVMVGLQ